MKVFQFLFYGFLILSSQLFGQQRWSLSGMVRDEMGNSLPGAVVSLLPGNHMAITNDEGHFLLKGEVNGIFMFEVSHLGFQKFSDSLEVNGNLQRIVLMKPKLQTLQEVIIKDNYAESRKREESLNLDIVNDQFLKQHLGGSLMQSLERLPGVSAITIGSGQSKPVIRGLGFNRVVVVENGIKHESQQWGTDHGLEVDQYLFDRIEVIKGPASLMYGSDAIGGVIELKQLELPQINSWGGSLDLTGKTNNNLGGTSLFVFGRRLFIQGAFVQEPFAKHRRKRTKHSFFSWFSK